MSSTETRSAELRRPLPGNCVEGDPDAYVRGEIDVDQLGQRVRARYGLS